MRNKPKFPRWLIYVIVVGVAAGLLLADYYLVRKAYSAHDNEVRMASIKEQSSRLSALEWQLISKQNMESDTIEKMNDTWSQISQLISEVENDGENTSDLKESYSEYDRAVNKELQLLAAGQLEEAVRIDAEEVDPGYEKLNEISSREAATQHTTAAQIFWLAYSGSLLVMFLGVLIISLLFWGYERNQRTERIVEAESIVLKENEERFRAITDNATEGIITIDSRGTLVYWNHWVANMFGYSVEEYRGKHFSELIAELFREPYQQAFEEIVVSGGESKELGQVVELSGLGKDGREFPLELSLSEWKLKGEAFFTVFLRDISNRKQEEQMLAESEARYRTLIEAAPDGIFVCDLEGKLLMCNQQAALLYGYKSPDEMAGINSKTLGSKNDLPQLVSNFRKVIESGETLGFEAEMVRTDGSRFAGMLRASTTKDIEGRSLGLIVSARDITERKKAEEDLLTHTEFLDRINKELDSLFQLSSATSQTFEIDEVIAKAFVKLMELEEVNVLRKGGLFLLQDDKMQLVYHLEQDQQFLKAHENMVVGDCLCGQAAKTGVIITSMDSQKDDRHTIRYPGMTSHGHVIVPIKTANGVIGVMYLYLPSNTQLDVNRIKFFQTFGNQLGIAIESARLYQETKRLSLHDPLTGLANRNLMNIELERNFAWAKRTGKRFSLLMLDLDHFKNYNDTHGHMAGDNLLVGIAAIISREIRKVDLAVRYGGEEFLVVLTETEEIRALDVAERIRKEIEMADFQIDGRESSRMTVSVGVVTCDETASSQDILISRADVSLYRAKNNGRNRTEFWKPD